MVITASCKDPDTNNFVTLFSNTDHEEAFVTTNSFMNFQAKVIAYL